MKNHIIINPHESIRNDILKNKNKLICTLKIIIDENICDIVFINELVIKNHKIDFLILTNRGHIIICEIKSTTKKEDLREALAQLIDYKNEIKKLSYADLFSILEVHTEKLRNFIQDNKLTVDILKEKFNNLNDDYYTICISKNINHYKLKYYEESCKNITNSFVILLDQDNLSTFKFNVEKININNKNIDNELSLLLDNALIKIKKDIFDSFQPTLYDLSRKVILLESLNKDTSDYLKSIINTLNLNISKTKITNQQDYDDFFPNNLDVSDEQIEKLRKMLICEYNAHSPISIRNFIKIITNNSSFPSWGKMHKYFHTTSVEKILKDGGLEINAYKIRTDNTTTRDNKKSQILSRISEIYDANSNVITEKILIQNNLSPNTIKYYFPSIYEAYNLAGVCPKNTLSKYFTRSEFITYFNTLILEFIKSNTAFTVKELNKHGITFYYIKKYYGSLSGLLQAFNITKNKE